VLHILTNTKQMRGHNSTHDMLPQHISSNIELLYCLLKWLIHSCFTDNKHIFVYCLLKWLIHSCFTDNKHIFVLITYVLDKGITLHVIKSHLGEGSWRKKTFVSWVFKYLIKQDFLAKIWLTFLLVHLKHMPS
jgi:hypothetical protein